jgi:hypothetical protein
LSARAVAAVEPGPTSIAPFILFLWRLAPSHASQAVAEQRSAHEIYFLTGHISASPVNLTWPRLQFTTGF